MQQGNVRGFRSAQTRWRACERLVDGGLPEAMLEAVAGMEPAIAGLVARRLAAAFAEMQVLLEKEIHPTFGVEPSTLGGSSDARRFREGSEALRLAGICTYMDLVCPFWWGWRTLSDPPPEACLSITSVPGMNERSALALKRHLANLKLIEPEA